MNSPGLLKGRHVVVVEDHEDSRDIIRQLLELEGATVTDVVTADAALWVLHGTNVDAVLTDLHLGGSHHDGTWLLREILASPRLNHGCVIAVTGRKELEHELLKLGFWAVLIKPIEPTELATFIVGCLERGRRGRPA